MDPVVLVAVVGLAGIIATGVIAPITIARQSAAIRHREKAEEWERLDLVESRRAAADAAQLEAIRGQTTKLDTIHGLVNSSYTAALESELRAHEAQLVLMTEVVALKRETGGYPDTGDESLATRAVMDRTRGRIVALKAEIETRTAAAAATTSGADADRIVAAIEHLPGQGGAPQDVKIVQPAEQPVPVVDAG